MSSTWSESAETKLILDRVHDDGDSLTIRKLSSKRIRCNNLDLVYNKSIARFGTSVHRVQVDTMFATPTDRRPRSDSTR